MADFLKPNGELLPLQSEIGEYFFFNITTITDALNTKTSDCDFWCEPPTTAVGIDHFEFHKKQLTGLSIFRIRECPVMTIVTNHFVDVVEKEGLNGFEFTKIWPFRPGTIWQIEGRRRRRGKRALAGKSLKKETLVLILEMQGDQLDSHEKRIVKRMENEVDAQLSLSSLNAPYFGTYEGSEKVDTEFRMFFSCPSADQLERKLAPWISGICQIWLGSVNAVKRRGHMYDENAKESWKQLR
ncbi:imm11 family protein [Lignipirellula cremea]|uniref:imm11 family protein n=1 Tax=Lignipirellula cremea TaxID=2528010 RepID=UPI0011A2EBB2|nr:DUF1629 domain-containing protein [Lignipirellula cremea]